MGRPARWAVGLAAAAAVAIATSLVIFALAYAIGGSGDGGQLGRVPRRDLLLGGLLASLAAFALAVVAKVKHERWALLWLRCPCSRHCLPSWRSAKPSGGSSRGSRPLPPAGVALRKQDRARGAIDARGGPGLEARCSLRQALVRAEHQGAAGAQRGRQRRRDFALELLVEVREGEVAAEDEVEGAAGGAGADVVAEEGDARGDVRPDPPARPLPDEAALAQLRGQLLQRARGVETLARAVQHRLVGVGRDHAHVPEQREGVRLLAGGAACAPGPGAARARAALARAPPRPRGHGSARS